MTACCSNLAFVKLRCVLTFTLLSSLLFFTELDIQRDRLFEQTSLCVV